MSVMLGGDVGDVGCLMLGGDLGRWVVVLVMLGDAVGWWRLETLVTLGGGFGGVTLLFLCEACAKTETKRNKLANKGATPEQQEMAQKEGKRSAGGGVQNRSTDGMKRWQDPTARGGNQREAVRETEIEGFGKQENDGMKEVAEQTLKCIPAFGPFRTPQPLSELRRGSPGSGNPRTQLPLAPPPPNHC